jgi:O-antigen ligase
LLVPLVLVAGTALDNGGFDASSWGWATLFPLVVVAVALLRGELRRPGPLGLAFLGLMAALVAWAWLSVAWSDDVGQSVLDGERSLVYLAAAAAFLAVERAQIEWLLAGVVVAITIVGGWALLERAFGGSGSYDVTSLSTDAARRLAAPVGYSNALGLLAAIGILLAAGVAVSKRRPLLAAPLLVLIPTLYLTYSRGAWLALGAGAIAALAVARPSVPKPVAVAVAVAAAAAVALALVRVGGPGGALRSFSHAAPVVKAGENRRLLSLSGSSRAQYWHVAWRQFEDDPLLGSGAGTFQRRWLRFRPAELPVLDAHSLYIETLAELGPLGLLMLAGLLGLPVAAAVLARDHPLAPAALGGYTAYLVHAAQDWDWEVPAVTLGALACGAALLTLAELAPRGALRPRVRAAGVGVAAALALAAFAALAGNRAIEGAASALDDANPVQAERDARRAERLAPWSPKPWRLHGEALLLQGKVEAARRDFRHALEKDRADWESWADLSLVADGAERREAAAEATRLNPLEPVSPTGG